MMRMEEGILGKENKDAEWVNARPVGGIRVELDGWGKGLAEEQKLRSERSTGNTSDTRLGDSVSGDFLSRIVTRQKQGRGRTETGNSFKTPKERP